MLRIRLARIRLGRTREAVSRGLSGFVLDQRGTETLEWGLVCGLLIIGAITVLTLIGPKITTMWNNLNNSVPATP